MRICRCPPSRKFCLLIRHHLFSKQRGEERERHRNPNFKTYFPWWKNRHILPTFWGGARIITTCTLFTHHLQDGLSMSRTYKRHPPLTLVIFRFRSSPLADSSSSRFFGRTRRPGRNLVRSRVVVGLASVRSLRLYFPSQLLGLDQREYLSQRSSDTAVLRS